MSKNTDALNVLFTDNDEVDSKELAELLSPYIKIRNEDNRIIFSVEGHRQTISNKMLLFLLGQKVLFLMKKIDSEYIAPNQVISETGLSRGSVLPALMKLKKSYLSVIEGKYFVPNHQVVKLKDNNIFSNEKNK